MQQKMNFRKFAFGKSSQNYFYRTDITNFMKVIFFPKWSKGKQI